MPRAPLPRTEYKGVLGELDFVKAHTPRYREMVENVFANHVRLHLHLHFEHQATPIHSDLALLTHFKSRLVAYSTFAYQKLTNSSAACC